MKKLAVTAALVLLSSICFATGTREATIERIEDLQMRSTIFTADSPFVASMLAPARQANPGVGKEDWDAVSREASSALSQAMTQPGGIIDSVYRTSLESLSDEELLRLETLLQDPVYRKFMAAMSAPATQQKVVQAMLSNTTLMTGAINSVMAKHGLNGIH